MKSPEKEQGTDQVGHNGADSDSTGSSMKDEKDDQVEKNLADAAQGEGQKKNLAHTLLLEARRLRGFIPVRGAEPPSPGSVSEHTVLMREALQISDTGNGQRGAHCARMPDRSEQRRGASPTRTHGQVGREKQEIRAAGPAQNKVMMLLKAESFRPVLFHSLSPLSRQTGKKRHPLQQSSQKNHSGKTPGISPCVLIAMLLFKR